MIRASNFRIFLRLSFCFPVMYHMAGASARIDPGALQRHFMRSVGSSNNHLTRTMGSPWSSIPGFVRCRLPQANPLEKDASLLKVPSNKLSMSLMSSNSNEDKLQSRTRNQNIAIIGGGLAGLSVAYHLLDGLKNSQLNPSNRLRITIYDKAEVGEGGASSVAGGLLHPFSPRGKLIHFGLQALEQSNLLVEKAVTHEPLCLIRPQLYRIALTPANVNQLQETAAKYPELAKWMSEEEISTKLGAESMGGLEMSNGCRVVHVPLYLKGLWEECNKKASDSNAVMAWEIIRSAPENAASHHPTNVNNPFSTMDFSKYDIVILSAGSGILSDKLIKCDEKHSPLPVQLVRGQSIEMSLPKNANNSKPIMNEAILCGKYISPLQSSVDLEKFGKSSDRQKFVIGASHEFQQTPLTLSELIEELKSRSYSLAPHLWNEGTVDRLTMGLRVQSHRGKFGRMPIVGRYSELDGQDGASDNGSAGNAGNVVHPNLWIFTGLSSRGMIYHGLFGKWLADAILHDDEEKIRDHFDEFDWWKPKRNDVRVERRTIANRIVNRDN
ncbi:hypothetical protein ACHAXS_006331 [Conticribra weissflogii]